MGSSNPKKAVIPIFTLAAEPVNCTGEFCVPGGAVERVAAVVAAAAYVCTIGVMTGEEDGSMGETGDDEAALMGYPDEEARMGFMGVLDALLPGVETGYPDDEARMGFTGVLDALLLGAETG